MASRDEVGVVFYRKIRKGGRSKERRKGEKKKKEEMISTERK